MPTLDALRVFIITQLLCVSALELHPSSFPPLPFSLIWGQCREFETRATPLAHTHTHSNIEIYKNSKLNRFSRSLTQFCVCACVSWASVYTKFSTLSVAVKNDDSIGAEDIFDKSPSNKARGENKIEKKKRIIQLNNTVRGGERGDWLSMPVTNMSQNIVDTNILCREDEVTLERRKQEITREQGTHTHHNDNYYGR